MTSHGLRQADYLSHMLEAATLAQSYVEGLGKANETVKQALPELENKLRQIQQSL